jgi:plastocyanin
MNSLTNQPSARALGSPRASRWVLAVASLLALALAGCSSGSATVTTAPATPVASTPAVTPTAPTPAPSSGAGGSAAAGDALQLSAQGIQYSTKQLQAPAGKAFTITFQNNDSGISHNVDILDANNTSIFKGAVFPGVASQTYQVPALKAGTYGFICDVHPNIMTGTLTVS